MCFINAICFLSFTCSRYETFQLMSTFKIVSRRQLAQEKKNYSKKALRLFTDKNPKYFIMTPSKSLLKPELEIYIFLEGYTYFLTVRAGYTFSIAKGWPGFLLLWNSPESFKYASHHSPPAPQQVQKVGKTKVITSELSPGRGKFTFFFLCVIGFIENSLF